METMNLVSSLSERDKCLFRSHIIPFGLKLESKWSGNFSLGSFCWFMVCWRQDVSVSLAAKLCCWCMMWTWNKTYRKWTEVFRHDVPLVAMLAVANHLRFHSCFPFVSAECCRGSVPWSCWAWILDLLACSSPDLPFFFPFLKKGLCFPHVMFLHLLLLPVLMFVSSGHDLLQERDFYFFFWTATLTVGV